MQSVIKFKLSGGLFRVIWRYYIPWVEGEFQGGGGGRGSLFLFIAANKVNKGKIKFIILQPVNKLSQKRDFSVQGSIVRGKNSKNPKSNIIKISDTFQELHISKNYLFPIITFVHNYLFQELPLSRISSFQELTLFKNYLCPRITLSKNYLCLRITLVNN